MKVYPNAKLNIGLNIVERRPDGYHNIETVFYPIQLHDTIEMDVTDEPSPGCTLTIDGNAIEGSIEDNLVVKAYRLLAADFKLPNVSIRLDKQVPTGAGLGGGSADAAYTLSMLNSYCNLGLSVDQLEAYAVRLGADCPFFIRNTPVFATGIGNVFTPVDLSLKGNYLVLIKPDVFVSTRDAYAGVTPKHPATPLPQIINQPLEKWRDCLFNDFEESVFPKFPAIQAIKESLYNSGAVYASMSGSGSSVFGIFDKKPTINNDNFKGYFIHTEQFQ